MMARLLNLAQELLLDIVERLEDHHATLEALCATSRFCLQLSRPSLYCHIRMRRDTLNDVQIPFLLRTAFDRPDLIALTTAFSIEAYAYENSDEALVPALGVIGILLNSGVHLEDAALDHARFLEQHSAPGLSNMIPYWKPGLRASARMAYIGVLLSLLSSVRDLAIAIYKEVGREAATILPLKHLFGLGMGEWDHDSSTYSHPYLSLVPNMKNVARLKTTGANISFLCLGLAHLEHLETNLVQETATMGRTNYVNTMCELHSFSLPEVRSLTMHIVWQGLLHKSDYDIVQFFETCHLPQLSNLNINITQGNLRTDGLPAGSIDSLLESIKPVSHYLQEFNLSVTCNGLSPRSHD